MTTDGDDRGQYIRELQAEIGRLRAEVGRLTAALSEMYVKNENAAAFLDGLAERLAGYTRWDSDDEQMIEKDAAECRAEARKLRE